MFLQHLSSYPTYEEWKHNISSSFQAYYQGSYPTYEEWKPKVDILSWFSPSLFLSYLWGMETQTHLYMEILWLKWFLSYLWGMETPFVCLKPSLIIPCSYPTYEEWKLLYEWICYWYIHSSYPTYEEWKHSLYLLPECAVT